MVASLEKLPFTEKGKWRWRWLYTENCGLDGKLHRIYYVDAVADGGYGDMGDYELMEDASDFVGARGTAACGLRAKFHMPGIMSRMGRPRCKKCCRRVQVPPGDGAPYNEGIDA